MNFLSKSIIFSEKKLKTIYDYEKDKTFDLSGFDNFIILFVSNSKYNLLKEISKSPNKIFLRKK